MLKPAHEHQLIRLRNCEGLAVHFLAVCQINVLADAGSDGMRRVDIPKNFVLVVTPQQIAGGTDDCLEDLGVVTGVQCDEAHALAVYALSDFLDQFIRHLAVCNVTPPQQHVCVIEHLIRQTVIRVVQRCGADIQLVVDIQLAQKLCNQSMQAFGINFGDSGLALLVAIFVPDRHIDFLVHDFSPLLAYQSIKG